jgi:protein gp37
MASKSSIEWTDATWNPIRGCTRVSEGCRNCYAERMAARRLPGLNSPTSGQPFAVLTPSGPRWTGNVELIESALDLPLRWTKPKRIFVNSMSDLFHASIPDQDRLRVFAMMGNTHIATCSQARTHTLMVLTKRHEEMRDFCTRLRWRCGLALVTVDGRNHVLNYMPYLPGVDPWTSISGGGMGPVEMPAGWMPPQIWLGVSVEDQEQADKRIPVLLDTPAAVRFVSAEPLLGPVDLSKFLDFNPGPKRPTSSLALNTHGQTGTGLEPGALLSSGDGHAGISPQASGQWRREPSEARVDWVIVGGESGPYARPMHPDWARSLRDQCQEADVPFFFKQWGEWQNGSTLDASKDRIVLNDGRVLKSPYTTDQETRDRWSDYHPCMMAPVGKKKAGRLLHGREWNEFPKEDTDV